MEEGPFWLTFCMGWKILLCHQNARCRPWKKFETTEIANVKKIRDQLLQVDGYFLRLLRPRSPCSAASFSTT